MKLSKSFLKSRAEVVWRFTCSNCGSEETMTEGLSPEGWEFEEGELGDSLCSRCAGNFSWGPELDQLMDDDEDFGVEKVPEWWEVPE